MLRTTPSDHVPDSVRGEAGRWSSGHGTATRESRSAIAGLLRTALPHPRKRGGLVLAPLPCWGRSPPPRAKDPPERGFHRQVFIRPRLVGRRIQGATVLALWRSN